jgi:hypothetical protein
VRRGADAAILVGLLALFGVLTYLLSGRQATRVEQRPRYSAFNPGASGYKAAYLLLKQRGVPVAAFQKQTKELPDDARVLIAASPYFALSLFGSGARWSEEDSDAVIEWVRDGGVLILLEDDVSALTEELDLDAAAGQKLDANLRPAQPAPFIAGIQNVFLPGSSRWAKKPERAVTLFGDKDPAVIAMARGRGVIYAVATPQVFSNRHLTDADNARLLVQMVEGHLAASGQGGGRVYFDEYHQGFETGRTFFDALGRSGQLTTIQLIVLSLLIAYSAGKRFGLPRPLPQPPRVSSEYVSSVAMVYQRARARDTVLEGVYLAFWRDLCRLVGQPLDASTEEIVTAAKGLSSGKEAGARLEKLLNDCEEAIALGPALKQDEMLRLARGLEEMRKELQIGRSDGRR